MGFAAPRSRNLSNRALCWNEACSIISPLLFILTACHYVETAHPSESTSACSSSADAIGVAYETIKRGDTKVMIAGGSEAVVNAIGVAAFCACKASVHHIARQEASCRYLRETPMSSTGC